jgi:DNA (cytosine-5)-methyltransferase 1
VKQKVKNLSIIDFFAGAGGLSLGALRAGFDLIGAIELDDRALDTHTRNFPSTHHFKIDLSKLSAHDICNSIKLKRKQLTGIIGGPPCQGFSIIGRRDECDVRNNLFMRFFEFIKELQPAFFVAENVLGILDDRYKNIRDKAFENLSNVYTLLPAQIVKANEYGAPTTRTRVFFVGYDKNKMAKLNEEDFVSAKVAASEQIRVRDALWGLPEDVSSFADGLCSILKSPQENLNAKDTYAFRERISGMIPMHAGDRHATERYRKHGVVSGCLPTKHSKEVMKRYSKLMYGQRDHVSKSMKLDPDGFCPTLCAGTGPERGSFQAIRPIHYSTPRVITPREAARLQGFPDWFDFHSTIWHSFRQIGNSVSPIVAEKMLSVIYHKLT